MRITILIIAIAFVLSGCGDSAPVSNQASAPSSDQSAGRDLETVTAHSADRGNRAPEGSLPSADGSSGGGSAWSRGGEPIDTTAYDAEIASAEKALKASPDSAEAKKALSAAYYKRGEALTDARQYAAALGDYRKAVKHDPSNADAKRWIEQIVVIYTGMNKEYPKEGEEPAPLPFKKGEV